MSNAKRKRDDDDDDVDTETPRKLHTQDDDTEIQDVVDVQTPSKKARSLLPPETGTPRSILKKTGGLDLLNGATPKSNRKLAFETPTKSPLDDLPNGSPTIVRNADRSARRKSNRRLFERTLNGFDSDDEALDEEEMLAQQILSDQDVEKEQESEAVPEPEPEQVAGPEAILEAEQSLQNEVPVPETPSKRGRGRPKGSGWRQKERAALLAQGVIVNDTSEPAPGRAPESGVGQSGQDETPVPETPSKRGRGRPKGSGWRQKAALQAQQNGEVVVTDPNTPKRGRGRPKGSFKTPRARSPTEPLTMPSHEEYFWQNRPGGAKTSDNTLPAQSLLNHDEYFQTMQGFQDQHENEMKFLLELHGRAYDQWLFELEQGFNICLYGYGSKRPITENFTAHLYQHLAGRAPYKGTKEMPKIAVINGYSSGTTIKDILATVASIAIPSQIRTPNQPASLLEFILNYLSDHPPVHGIPIILNSIDSLYLRKSPAPSMLAQLASHPSINLVCTADTPNFALLWDVGLKTQYKFIFHDATTFAPYEAEIDIVESVNELLGRSGRRVSGRDGVGFVLRSLPENARSLFRILVMEQLAVALMEEGAESDQDGASLAFKSKASANAKGATSDSTQGVEYRVLYHKAVEEFVCSSEVGFRTLLKEFHDHQMIESRKDAMGTERLWIPFRQEELEGLAEDLASDTF